ncbi:monocarboxylate transporter 12-like [Dermacentor albipictus]|uniref:monocarboxylate transporter 12-like n=1 Tax=Dermacentor albipictus TaxID=60249 RepID=UPI0038FCE51E
MAMLLVCLPSSYMPLLYVAFIEDYDISRESASWPESMLVMATHLSGLVLGALQRHLSATNMIVLASSLASIALVLSSFISGVAGMSITLGVMYGLGLGMFVISATAYNLALFDKYRGTTMSLIYIAWSAAGIVAPLLLNRLRVAYPLKGALLLTGALLMQAVPLSMLLSNPSPVKIARFAAWLPVTRIASANTVSKEQLPLPYQCAPRHDRHSDASRTGSYRTAGESMGEVKAEESLRFNDKRQTRDHTYESLEETSKCSTGPDPGNASSPLKHVASLLHTPTFYILLVATVVADYSQMSFGTTIVDYAVDKSIKPEDAAQLVAFSAVGKLLGRVVVVPLSDMAPASRCPLLAVGFALESLSSLMMTDASSLVSIAALQITEAVAQGYSAPARSILAAEYLGLDKFMTSAAFNGLVMIPVSFGAPSILGFFRDSKGSYRGFYQMLASVNAAVAIMLCAFSVLHCTHAQRSKVYQISKKQKTTDPHTARNVALPLYHTTVTEATLSTIRPD